MTATTTIVLVHSPLVGPLTWVPVATILRARDIDVLVPVLRDDGKGDSGTGDRAGYRPYWRQHVESVVASLADVPLDRALILVAHSGAGMLLPALGRAIPHRVAAYLYVDATLPSDSSTRLDDMARDDPDFAVELRAHLAAGGSFPEWSADDLRDVLSDAALRESTVDGLRPRPLAFFEETIPGIEGSTGAVCAYLQFSAPYAPAAERARGMGWPCLHIAAGHFHMLVDPVGVADALLALAGPSTPATRTTHAPNGY